MMSLKSGYNSLESAVVHLFNFYFADEEEIVNLKKKSAELSTLPTF